MLWGSVFLTRATPSFSDEALPASSQSNVTSNNTSNSANPNPVLLIYNDAYSSNKFGHFLGEIMKAEGFNLFDTTQVSSLTAALLASYDSVVLAQTSLSTSQATLLSQYVADGGNLLAMRPDSQLNSVFGIDGASGTLANGYLSIQTNQPYGQGLSGESLQLHTLADKYGSVTGQVLALLYADATTATTYPAVTFNSYGSGQAVAFIYDLASSVIYLRQGNPDQADVDADGDGVTRIVDMYYNWINLNKMPLPQADIQQRFFARILEKLNSTRKPLPRFWYFPAAKNTALVLTSDAHANPDSYYSKLLSDLQVYSATTTFYMAQAGNPSAANVNSWKNLGASFSIHPYTDVTSLSVAYDNSDAWFTSIYGPRTSKTVRIHRVQWQGWTDAAVIGATHGYQLDYTPYRYGTWLKRADNTWARGYMTGSGLPMKYINQNGQVINYFGQYTEIADDQMAWGPEQLSSQDASTVTKQAIDSSENGNYEAIVMQMHVDNNGLLDWQGQALGYARSLSIPVLKGDDWFTFIQNRYDSSFSGFSWNGSQLDFTATLPSGQVNQTLLLPVNSGPASLTAIKLNGLATSYTTRPINGENFAFLVLPAGISTLSVTYSGGATCDPLLINSTVDSMGSNYCEITLRKALHNATPTGGTVRLDKTKLTTTPVVINLATPLTIPATVKLDGGCVNGQPGLSLKATLPRAVQLSGRNLLKGVFIQTTASFGLFSFGHGNVSQCTKIKLGQ